MSKALEKLAEIKAFANVEPKIWQQAIRQDRPLSKGCISYVQKY